MNTNNELLMEAYSRVIKEEADEIDRICRPDAFDKGCEPGYKCEFIDRYKDRKVSKEYEQWLDTIGHP